MKLRVKENRKRAGMTQKQLATQLDVDLKTVGNWENGRSAMSLEDAVRVAIVLDCSPNDLCGWYEDHPRPDMEVLTDDERELISLHRQSTSEWRHNLIQNARASALASKDAAERDTSDVRKEA